MGFGRQFFEEMEDVFLRHVVGGQEVDHLGEHGLPVGLERWVGGWVGGWRRRRRFE